MNDKNCLHRILVVNIVSTIEFIMFVKLVNGISAEGVRVGIKASLWFLIIAVA